MAQRKSISIVNVTGTLGPSIIAQDSVKSISETILDSYDKENAGGLNYGHFSQIMKDMYKSMNMDYNPTKKEVEQFMRFFDPERKEMIANQNIEKVAKRYLSTTKYDARRASEIVHRNTNISPHQTQVLSMRDLNLDSGTTSFSNTLTKALYRQDSLMETPVQSNYTSEAKPKPTEDMVNAFAEFDFDKDGKINSFEFQRSLMRYGYKFGVNPIKINIEETFNSADTDKDGLISLQEFSSIILRIN